MLNSPERFERYIARNLNDTCLVLSEWYGSVLYVEALAWGELLSEVIESYPCERETLEYRSRCMYWEDLMAQAIHRGANCHYSAQSMSTLLGNWVDKYHPFTAQAIVRQWLRILQAWGMDTRQYLLREVELYLDQAGESRRAGEIRPRKIGFDGRLENAVTVAWKTDFPGPCRQVLEEFVYFGDDQCFSYSLSDIIPSERDWDEFWPYSWNSVGKPRGRPGMKARRSRQKRKVISGDDRRITNLPGAWVS